MTPREEMKRRSAQPERPDLKELGEAEKRCATKKQAARERRGKGRTSKPAQKRQASKVKPSELPASLNKFRLNAAGIDVGAYVHYVAVPEDRDPSPVRNFSSFTVDLERIADWLESCGIETVAMESTGVFWIPLCETLEKRGFEVLLVNPHQLRYAPARKSDVLDCQWIQELHTCGLLTGAFRPDEKLLALRSYVRQRSRHIDDRSTQVLRIQKALTEMNVQLKAVLSDVVGVTGLRILRAIVGGERNPQALAEMRDGRCRHDVATIAKALQGTWREEHLFALEQALELYEVYEQKIAACDQRIEAELVALGDCLGGSEPFEVSEKKRYGRGGANPFSFDAYPQLHRFAGIDLSAVPGIDAPTAMKVLSEIGTDMTRWRNVGAFCSWLGLCPGSKVTGGKRLSSKSKPCANKAAAAFRQAAYGLQRSKSYLGAFYRRKKGHLGAPKAITATAHKLARIVYAMLRDGREYEGLEADHYEKTYRRRVKRNLKRQAKQLGYCLVPLAEASDETALAA